MTPYNLNFLFNFSFSAISALVFVLVNPFINATLFGRFQLIGYLPLTILLAFIFSEIRNSRWRLTAATALMFVSLVPSALALPMLSEPSISMVTYADLQQLSSIIPRKHQALVITKHGLEWWTAWVVRADVSQEFNLDQNTWDQYSRVYFLVEKNPSPGNPFPEVRFPTQARLVFSGKNLELYTSPAAPGFYPLESP